MANVVIPHTFVPNTSAKASEVNDNFNAITNQVNGNLDATNLANNAVTEPKILDGAVTTTKINNGAVTTAKIGDGQITTVKIGDGQVTTTKIGDTQVTNAKIASGVDAAKLTTGTLPIARIADAAVTNAKLANVSTNTIKGRIAAGSGAPTDLTAADVRTIINVADGANNYVHPNHTGDVTSTGDGATVIANGAVTNAKLASTGLDAGKLTVGTLPIARIADGAITTAKTTATSANTAGAIVARDGSGNFAANAITAAADSFIHGVRVGRGAGSRSRNTSLGASALNANTTGNSNTATGADALLRNTTGNFNTAFGQRALENNTSSDDNVAVGNSALLDTVGANNIAIGSNAGNLNSPLWVTFQSNRIVMGNNDHTHAYVRIAWTVTSDERDKMNFKPVPHGLDFVTKLKPVAFQFKKSRDENEPHGPVHYGFKAQDVLKLEGDNPVMIDTEDPEHLKYQGESLVPVLVQAIQELKKELDELKAGCACSNKELV